MKNWPRCSTMQRQTLHEVTGLSREEATKKLLEMLDQELTQETGGLILKHQKRMEETVQSRGP